MSTNNTTKKRKVDSDESGISLAAVLAEMQEMKSKMDEMQHEMNGMKSRLSRMDERNTNLVNTINEINREYSSEIHELDTKCKLLKRSVKLLSKESNWEYSAPKIPSSYWTSGLGGYSQNDIASIKQFLRNIRTLTCALRSGEVDCAEIILTGNDDEGGFPSPYDNALLPHWREFANAIQMYPDLLHEFMIQNIQLTPSVIDLLVPVLKGKVDFALTLNNNSFTNPREGIEFAVQVIKDNNNMSNFEWMYNDFSSMTEAHYLADAIISRLSIDHVRLENCFGEGFNMDGYSILKLLIASDKSWKYIDFECNNFMTRGCTAIPDYIAKNPSLQSLYLKGNHLNDNDAILIAQALEHNTNLRQLSLMHNAFTDNGETALSKVLYDPTSLNSVSDSNHLLHLTFKCHCIHSNTDDNGVINPKMNRSRKIYHLLSVRNKEGSNVHHLNAEFVEDEDDDSLTLKLVPEVLESIQRYSIPEVLESVHRYQSRIVKRPVNKIPPLSIIYEILRGWKVPELYDTKRGNVSVRG